MEGLEEWMQVLTNRPPHENPPIIQKMYHVHLHLQEIVQLGKEKTIFFLLACPNLCGIIYISYFISNLAQWLGKNIYSQFTWM